MTDARERRTLRRTQELVKKREERVMKLKLRAGEVGQEPMAARVDCLGSSGLFLIERVAGLEIGASCAAGSELRRHRRYVYRYDVVRATN